MEAFTWLKGLSHLVQSSLLYLGCMSKDSAHSTGSVGHFKKYCIACKKSMLNMRTGGDAKNDLPSGFSRIVEKRRRAAPPLFRYLLTIELDTLCKNLSPRSPKVRSPGQVKVKNGFLTLRLRSDHTMYPIGFKLSAFHKAIDIYNLHISDFWYLWPEVRWILWPHHYKSMGKNSNCSYWMILRQNHLSPS